jgi:hypothetical protein
MLRCCACRPAEINTPRGLSPAHSAHRSPDTDTNVLRPRGRGGHAADGELGPGRQRPCVSRVRKGRVWTGTYLHVAHTGDARQKTEAG